MGTLQPVFDKAASDIHAAAGGAGKGEITSAVVATVWNKINPGIMRELDSPSSLGCIAPRPLLVINGELDPRCPKDGVQVRNHFIIGNAATTKRITFRCLFACLLLCIGSSGNGKKRV